MRGVSRLAKSLDESPVWKVAVALIGVIGVTVGVLTYLSLKPGAASSAPPLPTSSSAMATVSTSAPASVSPSPADLEVGACLDVYFRRSDCESLHAYQVFALLIDGQCPAGTLMSFLGGSPSVDVLLPTIKIVSQPDRCLLSNTGDALVGDAHDILRGPNGDSLRYCWDLVTDRYVACSVPHGAEVVSLDTRTGDMSTTCQQRVESYLGTPLSGDLAHELRARLVAGNVPQCRVEVLGDNVLTASLRRLSSQAPPIEPMS